MATCKDCIHYEVCENHAKMLEEDGYEVEFDDTPEVEKRCAAFKPTADVVPKSEYDAVVSAVDNSTNEFLKLHCDYQKQKAENERLNYILHCYALEYGTVKDKQAVIDKAKAEVAREIFEDIWASIATHAFTAKSEDYEDGVYDTIEWVDSKIAELKKKYTEEQV